MTVEGGTAGDQDGRIAAVLTRYHERMRDEAAMPGAGDWQSTRLLAVGSETGALLRLLARSLAAPRILELGTSFGYSTLWLAEGARAAGGRVTTIELAEHKSTHAAGMLAEAALDGVVDLLVGDALTLLPSLPGQYDLVLLDLWKELYAPIVEPLVPRLAPGAMIVADNMIRPGGENADRYRAALAAIPGITSVLLPIGTGLEISRLAPRRDAAG